MIRLLAALLATAEADVVHVMGEATPALTRDLYELDPATVEQFAELTRTELVLIDGQSTPSSVRKELRWNAAYQLLAGGLR